MKEIIKILTSKDTIRDLTPKEKQAGENVMRACFNVKRGEKVVVVTDSGKLDEAAVFFESAKNFTDNVELVEMVPRGEHAQEPPDEVVQKMCSADALCLVTTWSLSHTKARKLACSTGARAASMPTISKEMITRTLVLDYRGIAELSKEVADVLTKGRSVRITSPKGTDIEFSINGRKADPDTGLMHEKGDFCNLPAGEAYLAPVEGTANGVIVFDGCFADIELDEPIRLTVEEGMVTAVEGGKAAKELEQALNRAGEKARNIAELGVGTNKAAKISKQGANLLEVEKLYGTVHIALGNNAHFGGTVDVPFHRDGVILNPRLKVDGKVILEDGEFRLDNG